MRENEEIDTIGAIKDSLSLEQIRELLQKTGANAGDLLLFGAGDTETVHKSLSRLRLVLGERLGLIDAEQVNLLG